MNKQKIIGICNRCGHLHSVKEIGGLDKCFNCGDTDIGYQDEPTQNKQQEYFPITSVSRADLDGLGYDTSKVDDSTMERLAEKMGEAYTEQAFWIDLPIIADNENIPKK